jgi:hypothetical protein
VRGPATNVHGKLSYLQGCQPISVDNSGEVARHARVPIWATTADPAPIFSLRSNRELPRRQVAGELNRHSRSNDSLSFPSF